eukprot:2894019-Amphidinium_carterae.1
MTTETVSMQHVMVVRRERLSEHIASVPARLMTGVRDTQRTQSNMQDLERFPEHEHNVAKSILTEGRQFYVYVEQQAR